MFTETLVPYVFSLVGAWWFGMRANLEGPGAVCVLFGGPPSLTTILVSTTGYVGDLLCSRVCWRLLHSFTTAVPLVLGSRAAEREGERHMFAI